MPKQLLLSEPEMERWSHATPVPPDEVATWIREAMDNIAGSDEACAENDRGWRVTTTCSGDTLVVVDYIAGHGTVIVAKIRELGHFTGSPVRVAGVAGEVPASDATNDDSDLTQGAR